ncbi:mechanosensitive ion channel domain-containing protein [Tenacibaculum finnmarkense]|uniref:Mechanosensitive ion channel n=2 Tax=Tenacibaculum finnmarkense TaxID=2781243 RepID=A0AAP1RGS9_9FLAO|nr:mechanosensitive ion channel domain-containing protein [Tenacibaculum finnmarkense]MBE7653403.1 mechanosensitive ion channel [Tenacibaculum finnmarkense genomovar finnmarkense]MBE7660527.1 mechanosensitive ion channel [Tenacibaculum finnmarkense genomovar finnmarkense]MBE7688816.1 mechanosensitive ion channel [Tenacibaculum finnmarkense genomovar ulcerans]MBE7693525.1 mechanosensitive ion channel [Tenacibaculum finnmarkense genomovar finnmarkense]MBE7695743.1 mechanosensitive ion channel [T
MKIYYIKILESVVTIILYLILRKNAIKIINKTLSDKFIHSSRGMIIKKIINIILSLTFLIFISLIWGVKQADLAGFIGSVLTFVGVAFFAQWSLLSNITSSIILFFNHPVKLNDSIVILEAKDYVIEGRVINIGLFFITLQTKESGEITLPNNIFILKSIKNITKETKKEANITNENHIK